MSSIQKYQPKIANKIYENILNQIFSGQSNDRYIYLVIKIEDNDLNVKDFSTYLELVYRVDGLLSRQGFNSYSKSYDSQIKITKVSFGSIELTIEKLLSEIGSERLIFIWLILKYLPTLINGTMEATNKYYDTLLKREEYLEKVNNRKQKKNIRSLVYDDAELSSLEKKDKEKIVNVLNDIYNNNPKKIGSAFRFARNSVKSVKIKRK